MYNFGDYTLIPRFNSVDKFVNAHIKNASPQILLLLTLKGAFSIKKESISKKVIQNVDYTILGQCKNNKISIINFTKDIEHTIQNIDFAVNYSFYKTLIIEYLACIHANKLKQGIVSLIHIYRILERVSFTLPLLYAKKSNDYLGIYKYFKEFFTNADTNIGELKFLIKSLHSILDDTEKIFYLHMN